MAGLEWSEKELQWLKSVYQKLSGKDLIQEHRRLFPDRPRSIGALRLMADRWGWTTNGPARRSNPNRDHMLSAVQEGGAEAQPKLTEPELIAHLRSEIKRLQSESAHLRDVAGSRKEFTNAVKEALRVAEPLPPIKLQFHPGRTRSEISAVLKLSDWHIGEVINPNETEGLSEFNWQIAKQRTEYLAERFLASIQMYRTSFCIPSLYIFCEGDFIHGDLLHYDAAVTNEFPAPVQAVRAGGLLARMVGTLAPHFKRVTVVEAGGDNHARLTIKPQFKQRAQNSFGFVVYALANEILSHHRNVQITQGDGIKILVDVAGWKFLSLHGDTIRGWMGIPYYGLERERAREASKRMAVRRRIDLSFDYISCGHFHTPAIISENILINGSLTGTNEFDHAVGRHSGPSQVSFLVHPKHGFFGWTSWKAQ